MESMAAMHRSTIALLLAVFFSSACFAMAGRPAERGAEISIGEAMAIHEKKEAVFLDVREPHEYMAGHIRGAINVPQGLLESKIGKEIPDKNAKIVVYCRTERRSASAVQTLSRMGYRNAVSLKGGWEAFKLETT